MSNEAGTAHWLNRGRLRLYSRLVLVFFLVFFLGYVRYSNLVDPKGYTIVSDFTVFWAASKIALAGHPQDAYSVGLLHQAVDQLVGNVKGEYGWFYPPAFYLLVLPLALLPYLPSYLFFMLSTLMGYVVVMRRIITGKEAMWCLAAFPGIWINILRGQNGFLTAALAGAALLNLPKRPLLAGVFIGLLAIKPHLALMFPVALIAIGAWRTILAAVAVAIAFMTTGAAVLGTNTLEAWLNSLGFARVLMENGADRWPHMPSFFAFFRLLGAPVTVAYGAQALGAIAATLAVWKVWRHSDSWPLRGAVLTIGTLLVSPYLMEYDLTWLALPVAWLAQIGLKDGWLKWEREILVAAWLLPLVTSLSATTIPAQVVVSPLVLLALLLVTMWRAYAVNITERALDRTR